jgi:glucose-1-phosphate thymidylyltransferase
VKVIIPLAGKGTRLRPHTHVTPKPLVRVGGKPVMSYILDDLERLGVEEIVFITGYLRDAIEAYIRTEYPGFRAHFVEQPIQDGTAGASPSPSSTRTASSSSSTPSSTPTSP